MIGLSWLFLIGLGQISQAAEVKTPSGVYAPLFRDKEESNLKIAELYVDRSPVTNEEFLSFIRLHPQWQRSKIKSLFADKTYLKHWTNDLSYPQKLKNFPVVYVSWFAAKSFCESQKKRLPTIAEWEYFSDAQNPEIESKLLEWYAKPEDSLRPVEQGKPNKLGIHDSIGLVWEWVDDFSSVFMSGDSRRGPMNEMFCGGESLGSKDPKLYAAFIRFAFRSSLKASYTTSSLGFRCVRDIKEVKK